MLVQSTLPFPAPEEWRAIPGFEGLYEVSDLGRVRALRFRQWGHNALRATPLMLRHALTTTGYPFVQLTGLEVGKPVNRVVHRLVLEAFVGPCPPEKECSHLNGQPTDARLVNLRWETHTENERRKVEHGTLNVGDRNGNYTHPERRAWGDRNGSHTHPENRPRGERHSSRTHPERVARGERHPNAKLTAAQVIEIRAAAARGELRTSIAARLGVGLSAVHQAARRATWKHLP